LLNDNAWDTTADVVLACGTSADGGARVEFQLLSAAVRCTFVPSPLTVFDGSPWQYRARVGKGDPTVPLNASSRGVAGELGGVWGLSNGVGAELLAQVPVVTTGLVDHPLVGVRVGSQPVDYELCDAGLVSVDTGTAPLTGAVEGHPTWGVFSSVRTTPGIPYEVIETHGDGLAWPRRPEVLAVFTDPNPPVGTPIAAGPAGDGGTLLLAIGQSLYVADLPASPVADPTLAPPLRFAAIIQPGVNLTALLQAPPSTGASYTLAWAIAGGRVFRVRADNHVVWRVDAPLDRPTEAVTLFADGPRVRVGFSDGSVFAAPSGTLLAAPLQSNASVALDFADVCGNEFMATRDALYELVVDQTSAIGTWTRVPLAATGLLATPLARLQSDGTGLLVYRERGVVERLTSLTCLPKQ
jgi:hypothetical protein